MGAVWQVVVSGTKQQQAEAAEILADTRRKLYGLLAEGDEGTDGDVVMNGPELRIGDAEREAAVTALGEHYAAGRLTKEEYDERAERAWAARTASAADAAVRRPAPARRPRPGRTAGAAAPGARARPPRLVGRRLDGRRCCWWWSAWWCSRTCRCSCCSAWRGSVLVRSGRHWARSRHPQQWSGPHGRGWVR